MGRLAKRALIEDVKRDIIMELNQTHGRYPRERHLIDSIKRDVLSELGSKRTFVEAVKNEVLAEIRGGTGGHGSTGVAPYPDQATINAVKNEVLAQIEAEQETREQSASRSGSHGQQPDPALVEAVKNSVLAEINPHHRPSL